MRLLITAAALAAALGLGAQAINGAGPTATLGAAKGATAGFQTLGAATRHGYGLVKDVTGLACIADPGVGAMGEHYVRPDLLKDATVDARRPEALVYEPLRGGARQLVAAEYIVLAKAWDAGHAMPPMLFGRMFMKTPAPNRFGLPAFYSLHAWLWKSNPAGTLSMWNPSVTCRYEPKGATRLPYATAGEETNP
jgi:hypothetical protein